MRRVTPETAPVFVTGCEPSVIQQIVSPINHSKRTPVSSAVRVMAPDTRQHGDVALPAPIDPFRRIRGLSRPLKPTRKGLGEVPLHPCTPNLAQTIGRLTASWKAINRLRAIQPIHLALLSYVSIWCNADPATNRNACYGCVPADGITHER